MTNTIFEPKELIKYYPRGEKALLGPFFRFNSSQTQEWFEQRGVKLKTESDGRVFPVSDRSQTIIDCLMESAVSAGVIIRTKSPMTQLMAPNENSTDWKIILADNETITAQKILIATGSNGKIWDVLKSLGHTISNPVPSLFSFNVNNPLISGLAGLSVPTAICSITGLNFEEKGPLLITHWGFSGPVILRLSAWAAKELNEKKYDFQLVVNWTGMAKKAAVENAILEGLKQFPRQKISNRNFFGIPSRLWEAIVKSAKLREMNWADIRKEEVEELTRQLFEAKFIVKGKSTNKDEFVTCGGVNLDEVDFRTMQSKKLPGLFFAGEVLDIDAITGGFNFQAAWTTGWVAGEAIAE